MKRTIPGLNQASTSSADDLPDGIFLVRVIRAQHHWHRQKSYYLIRFAVLESQSLAGAAVVGQLHSTSKAL